MKFKLLNRKIHYWLSAIAAIPILIVIITGLLLIVRKDVSWVQPPSQKGIGKAPTITFNQILDTAKTVQEANITSWKDISKLDVRPSKGIVKVRAKNRWEVQIDTETSDILQVAYRRSGLIESIHDGTFFSKFASYGIWLPSAIILLILWLTGIYMFIVTLNAKKGKK